MFKRQLSDFGIHPFLGQVVMMILFVVLAVVLFKRTEYAAYLFVLAGTYGVFYLNYPRRNSFLKSIFSIRTYQIVRRIESAMLASPFIVVLCVYSEFWFAGLLILVSGLLSGISTNSTWNYKISTPFYRYPFEFAIGFRNTFLGIFLAYFLTFMAIRVDNFNLGVFSVFVLIIICLSYYLVLEEDYYIWIYKSNPKTFLMHKLKTAVGYCLLICIPVLISLWIAFPDEWRILVIGMPLGLIYLAAMVLGKYASYPHQPSFPQAIWMGMCLFFPPLLLMALPYFYSKSQHRLQDILV